MTERWINPQYRTALHDYEAEHNPLFPVAGNVGFMPLVRPAQSPVVREASSGGNCGNCGGAGRIIYQDPSSGQMKDIPCGSCAGSGQSSL